MDFEKMMNSWLDSSETWKDYKKDSDSAQSPGEAPAGRAKLRKMKPEAELDLHGKTVAEAEIMLSRFIIESFSMGLKKVMIIHGKGNHSSGDPVLGKWVKKFLENCTHCGETGTADRKDGGTGATWVIFK